MNVTVTNKTEYPTGEVRRLVRRALLDIGADDVDVTVHYRKCMQWDPLGRQPTGEYRNWWHPSRGQAREQIRIGLPRPGIQPADFKPYKRKRGTCPVFELRDWREALIAVAAHEGMHHRQTPRNGWGSTGPRYREDECDLAAFRAVRYYREDTTPAQAAV